MIRTVVSQAQAMSGKIVLPERETGKPFLIIPIVDPSVYDDPEFVLTIRVETVDPATGRVRGMTTTHRGRPMGKSRRWGCGMKRPPLGLRSIITIETSKPAIVGVELEEDG